jgi:hypothetical protein
LCQMSSTTSQVREPDKNPAIKGRPSYYEITRDVEEQREHCG